MPVTSLEMGGNPRKSIRNLLCRQDGAFVLRDEVLSGIDIGDKASISPTG